LPLKLNKEAITKEPDSNSTLNSQRTREKAEQLFPQESWYEIEKGIFLAQSRKPKNKNQEQILEKEIEQARILVQYGSTVYFLPEEPHVNNEKHPDAIVDGEITEFKTIEGGIRKVEARFKEARMKADRVFLKIDSSLTKENVIRKLKEVIVSKSYCNGQIIVYFTENKHLYFWDVKDL